jgi:anti-sigma B factor antagonist
MSAPTLTIDWRHVRGVHVVVLSGAIDAASVEQVRRVVEPLLAIPDSRVLLDCHSLAYVNSTGFGLFFGWSRACEGGRNRFALAGLARKLANLMKVLGMENFVTVYSSREAALAAMEGAQGP